MDRVWRTPFRFLPPSARAVKDGGAALWYVGAHDSASFLSSGDISLHDVDVHLFEPLWDFFSELLLKAEEQERVHAHYFGIGSGTAPLNFTLASMQTTASNYLEFSKGSLYIYGYEERKTRRNHTRPALVRDAAKTLRILHPTAANLARGVFPALDLLFMACMGCEYAVVESLANAELLAQVGVVFFFSFMVLSDEEIERVMVWEGVLDVASALRLASDRYCALHRLLRRNHARDFGAPWGMERWTP